MTTRRGFFKLVAGAALMPVAAKAGAVLPSVPVLYADLLHDDTRALQALFDGKVVAFNDQRLAECINVRGNTYAFDAVRFLVRSTLNIGPQHSGMVVMGLHLVTEIAGDAPTMRVAPCVDSGVTFDNTTITRLTSFGAGPMLLIDSSD